MQAVLQSGSFVIETVAGKCSLRISNARRYSLVQISHSWMTGELRASAIGAPVRMLRKEEGDVPATARRVSRLTDKLRWRRVAGCARTPVIHDKRVRI